ncbi:hypothetical protein CXG81DRAFT_26133 [Caulochytrium protostelioides]|uniref:Nucleic acid-binding protein n=1 Tax=Caulochytrium protostelioides TaxID=1555241 RepID=A0A4P9X7F9_9FUNG|nr:hypothetical protein CXG81DRAFT_26133 [Caulochytrium protostelioides]|eukprot:RKP01165.1 hypothetical protein CXG81DRAFT_26133 [Caulochytrium protostelioides]
MAAAAGAPGSGEAVPTLQTAVSPLRDTTPARKSMNVTVIVLAKKPPRETARNNRLITTFHVADASGSLQMSVWGPLGPLIQIGDMLRVNNAQVRLWRDGAQLQVRADEEGPHGGTIQRFGQECMYFLEKPNHSHVIWESDGKMNWQARPPPQPPQDWSAPPQWTSDPPSAHDSAAAHGSDLHIDTSRGPPHRALRSQTDPRLKRHKPA